MDNNELKSRKPTRLKDFDYSTNGAYFIMICTQNRRKILSRIYQPSKDFAIKNAVKIFGNDIFTTIL